MNRAATRTSSPNTSTLCKAMVLDCRRFDLFTCGNGKGPFSSAGTLIPVPYMRAQSNWSCTAASSNG
jgi:hypothetical protein